MTDGLLRPLVDEHGTELWQLPCRRNPRAWDDDAPARVHRAAARLCREVCPGRALCYRRMLTMWPDVTGVWAGMILTKGRPSGRGFQPVLQAAAEAHDHQVMVWAAQAGITLPGGAA